MPRPHSPFPTSHMPIASFTSTAITMNRPRVRVEDVVGGRRPLVQRRSAFKWQEIWKKLKFKSLIYESRFICRLFAPHLPTHSSVSLFFKLCHRLDQFPIPLPPHHLSTLPITAPAGNDVHCCSLILFGFFLWLNDSSCYPVLKCR